MKTNLIDIDFFNNEIVGAYNDGTAEKCLSADESVARSLIPPGTGILRDFSYIAPELPEFLPENCVGCMECVTECPDTAILGKVVEEEVLETALSGVEDLNLKNHLDANFVRTNKYYDSRLKQGKEGGKFGIFIDPTKCKGCGECVDVCGDHNALKMIGKTEEILATSRKSFDFFVKKLPATPEKFIDERILTDMMLSENAMLYVGGAGSCMGCGEATAIRMMLAATGFVYGKNSLGIAASTGCNSVFGATYPYNPYKVPWSNSLFENSPTFAMGIRSRWNQRGEADKKLWVLGGDGAMFDIGFQALSRMLTSGMDINVMVLDTQVYSNTGGQTSTASFVSQEAKMSSFGKKLHGKVERRKEIAQIATMHPDIFVAQTTTAHINHFYKAVMAANEYKGASIINVYTPCMPEHGISDDASYQQSRLAVNSRAFPLFIHDPRKGEKLSERIDLKGNPALKDDWYVHPKTKEPIDFITFARTEGRFAKNFDKEGNPGKELLVAREDRVKNWRLLQELAGII
ncbi:4Fe-4S binding protein [bacterium]|nr:4Fe-4S binding protein [bacterium]